MLKSGTALAGYRIDGVLGTGGMGVVYEATQLSLQRTVALKVIAPHLSADAGFSERFRHEATIQAGLEHPHIVAVYETGESDEGLYLAMRLVRGASLRQLIVAGDLSASRALRILGQAAAALDAAHAAGLIHRDVKPQNILVDERDYAYLADFGLIKAVGGGGPTRTGQYLGTLDYVSPEQIRGEPLTLASDIYALSAVLYECLTGEVPFSRDTEAAMLYAHLADPPPRLMERRAELPPALDAVIARGLAKQADDRFASASELVAEAQAALNRALEALVDGGPPRPAAPAAQPASAAPPRHESRGVTIVDPGLLKSPPVIVEEPERRLSAWWLAGLAGLVLALALSGFGLGRVASAEADPSGVAVAGPLTLSFFEDEWEPARTLPRVAGLTFADPLALVSSASGKLLAGTVPAAEGELLLPERFVERLRERPRPEPVRLGRLAALRYRGLRHESASGLTLYVVPTTGGAATIACLAPAGEGGTELDRCEEVAATASLRGGRALPLGPTPGYASALRSVVSKLNARSGAARRVLGRARTQGGQAGALRRLAAGYRAAASALRKIGSGPRERPAHRSVLRALDEAAQGYGALAAAARAGNAPAYARLTSRVKRAETRLRRSLRALGQLGYTVGPKRS